MPALRDEGGDGSDSEPAWLKKFSSPAAAGRAAAVASSSASSSEDANEAVRTTETAKETSEKTQSDARAKDAVIASAKPTTVKPAPAPAPPPPRDGSSTSSSTRVDLVATANLGGKSKVLFEIEGAGEAIDLDGDTGAVGRWLAESSRALKVDMKGVMYNARVVPAAGSIVVVALNGDVAKIESVHREFIQLRQDPNACGGVQNLGVGSLFDRDDDDDDDEDDDDDPPAPRASLGATKRKRSTDAAGAAKRAPQKRKQKQTSRAKPKPGAPRKSRKRSA